jgi:hypothetical protein
MLLCLVSLAGLGAVSEARARVTRQLFFHPTGSLTFTWRGDPSRGCAAEGLCGVTGSIVVRAGGSANGVGRGLPRFEVQDEGAIARVTEESAGGAVRSCVELEGVDVQLSLSHKRGGGLVARRGGVFDAGPSAGRCAGPTASDLAALVLPARKLGRHGYDLSGAVTFGAAPFEIRAVSSLRGYFEHETIPVGFGPPPVPPGGFLKPRRVLEEDAQVTYRVVAASGQVGASFFGVPDPFCEPVGTCGATGSISLGLGARGQRLTFDGSREVKHRVAGRQVLLDLRSGRLAVSDSSYELGLSQRLIGRLTWPDGSTCTDAVLAPAPLESRAGHGGDIFLLAPQIDPGFPSSDPLRTHCPGPSDVEMTGGSPLAEGTVAVDELGAPRITLTLTASGVFSGDDYQGARSGTIVLTLVRVGVKTETRRVLPGGGAG